MRKHRSRYIFIGLLLLVSLSLKADVTIGFVFFNPPFVFNASEGFDVELADNLCARLKIRCKKVLIPIEKLYTALKNHEIDLAMGGLVISKERLSEFAFTIPYMLSRGQFVVKGSDKLKTIDELKGKKIAVIEGDKEGTVYYNYLKAHDETFFKIEPYRDPQRLMADFYSNDVKAAFIDKATALYWVQNSAGKLSLLGDAIILGLGMGIAALPENHALISKINESIMGLENDGTYLRLYRMYLADDV